MGGMLLPLPPSTVAAVTEVRFYPTSARSGGDAVPVEATLGEDGITVDETGVDPGRWYLRVIATDEDDADASYNPAGYYDLPIDNTLVVSPETLAVKANLPLPLTETQREVITDAIRDAQADVTAYLGVPILPTLRVDYGCYAYPDGWRLPGLADAEFISIDSVVAEYAEDVPTGYFTVRYWCGYDARLPENRPLLRYVVAHAMNSDAFVRVIEATGVKGRVKSLSVTGQAVSFDRPSFGTSSSKAGDGQPGSLPTLGSLDFWRSAGRRVHEAPTRSGEWPFTGARW